MSRTQYPVHVEPVSLQPETVTESRWHQPWSEPRRDKVVKAFAVALIASGGVLNPFPLPDPEPVTESRWHQPWSEPVRFKPGLSAQQQQVLAAPVFVPTPEDITLDKWLYQWTDPVRKKPGLAASLQQPIPVFVVPGHVGEARWFNPFSEPVRRSDIRAALQPTTAFTPAFPFQTPSVDQWGPPLSTPTRRKTALEGASTFIPFFTASEVITPDKWFVQFVDPPLRPILRAGSQQYSAYVGAEPFAETVSVDRWNVALSEPIRQTRRPEGSIASVTFVTSAEVITLDKWYEPFSEPARRRGIPSSEQQVIALGPLPITASIGGWYRNFDTPMRRTGLPAYEQQALSLGPFPIPASLSGWSLPLSEPLRQKRITDINQPVFVGVVSTEIVTVDKWYRDLNIPPRGRSYSATLALASFQSNYLVPAPYVDPPMASWSYSWSAPVRLRTSVLTASQSGAVGPIIPQPNPPGPSGVYTVSGLYVIDQFTDNTVVYDYSGGVSHRTN